MITDDFIQEKEALIPDKFNFQIAEVCEITELPKSVVRYWETEFKSLTPNRTSTGRRLYRRKDILQLFKIKFLLYEKKFTIEGARTHLESRRKESPFAPDQLEYVRRELLSIRRLLD